MRINWSFVREVGLLPWAVRYSRRQFHKRVLHRDSRMRLPTGAWITLPAQSGSATEAYITNGRMDWGSEAILAQFADKSRDFLDIGAHAGYYAGYLSPCVRRVYAFEPDHRNLAGLRENARSWGNVEVIASAVSSRDGVATFYQGSGSAVSSLESTLGGPVGQVPVITIDTFAAARSDLRIGLVKTDIEGHDLQALRGMQRTVARDQPLILSECEYSAELLQVCNQWNYETFAFARDRTTMALEFIRVRPEDAERWFKMFFLVPERLQASFHLMTRSSPTRSHPRMK